MQVVLEISPLLLVAWQQRALCQRFHLLYFTPLEHHLFGQVACSNKAQRLFALEDLGLGLALHKPAN